MIPVVDLSKHQGAVDFVKMRANHVEGVIIRAGNGEVADPLFRTNAIAAHAAGLKTGAYWFCNPRVGTATQQGRDLCAAAHRGDCDLPSMLDVESDALEPHKLPAPDQREFMRWIGEMVSTVSANEDRLPIMYTNASYWDREVASVAFGDLDLIAARYPFYSPTACAAHVPPVDARQWGEWIMHETTLRPPPPMGWADWQGWQFSAGFNGRGATYGASSRDLDLNIIRDEVWARWIGTPQPPTAGAEMDIVTNAEPRTFEGQNYQPGEIKFAVMDDGTLRHIGALEGRGRALQPTSGVRMVNADLDAWPVYTAPSGGAASTYTGPVSLSGSITLASV